jgi:hypothetical protein
VTVDEVAALLKVRPGWIAKEFHSKRLPFPHIKVGVYPRFPVSGVRKFLDEQLKQVPSKVSERWYRKFWNSMWVVSALVKKGSHRRRWIISCLGRLSAIHNTAVLPGPLKLNRLHFAHQKRFQRRA